MLDNLYGKISADDYNKQVEAYKEWQNLPEAEDNLGYNVECIFDENGVKFYLRFGCCDCGFEGKIETYVNYKEMK